MMRKTMAGALLLALLCGCFVSAPAEEAALETTEQYLAALIEAGTSAEWGQYTSFEVHVTDGLLAELSADGDALLHQLELMAGLVEVHYNSSGTRIRYRNSVFGDALYAEDIPGLMDALNQGPFELERDIYVVCSDALYAQLTGDLWQDLRQICNDCCGMVDVRYATAGLLPVVRFTPTKYYASFRMIEALRTGDLSALSAQEQEALQVAQEWAAQIVPGDAESVMRQIHDLICERVTYDAEMTLDARHSCVGALLHGRCVCDGYADTFMLLGTMCGLDVRMQIGATPTGEELMAETGNHAWNMVRVDGEWRMVDVTWDDGSASHDYFNLSRSAAPDSHTWTWGPEGWER